MQNTAFATPLSLGITNFAANPLISSKRSVSSTPTHRQATIHMTSPVSLAKKQAIIEVAKKRLAVSEAIFSVPLDSFSVMDVYHLKQELPKGTTAATVKNSLMRRAIADTKWEIVGEIVKQSSLWFFIEDDFKGTVNAYQKFVKGKEREQIRGGVFENEKFDGAGIEALAALPTKKELIAQFAGSINMVTAKIASAIKAVPTNLAVVIKLAVADEESSEGEST